MKDLEEGEMRGVLSKKGESSEDVDGATILSIKSEVTMLLSWIISLKEDAKNSFFTPFIEDQNSKNRLFDLKNNNWT